MSKRFKDFGSNFEVPTEPITFKVYDQEFSCIPSLPGRTLLKLVSQSGTDDASAMANTIEDFFATCLMEKDKDRFFELLDNPEKVVPVETLAEIVAWLVEEYSGRPTQGPEDSPNGQ